MEIEHVFSSQIHGSAISTEFGQGDSFVSTGITLLSENWLVVNLESLGCFQNDLTVLFVCFLLHYTRPHGEHREARAEVNT